MSQEIGSLHFAAPQDLDVRALDSQRAWRSWRSSARQVLSHRTRGIRDVYNLYQDDREKWQALELWAENHDGCRPRGNFPDPSQSQKLNERYGIGTKK